MVTIVSSPNVRIVIMKKSKKIKYLDELLRIKGRWTKGHPYDDHFPGDCWFCSECELPIFVSDPSDYRYCPRCGTDMRKSYDTID